MLSLFLLFFFAFIFTSLIAHICSSVIENECSALRFFVVQARGSFRYLGEKLYHHLFFAYGILYITTPANIALLFEKVVMQDHNQRNKSWSGTVPAIQGNSY